MDIPQLHTLFLAHRKVTTDTRKIEEGSLFFALKGPNFDGNAFAAQALEKGAVKAIVDDTAYAGLADTILVDDVLECLQQLATYHRRYCKAKVIALTGSNGKTTTKELIHAVLATTFNTLATQGNLNNHIGVPLTLLTLSEETELAVIEMGANHQGEIAMLSKLAEPDFGLITNFGKAHLEGFGGVEGVIKGKSELYRYLIDHDAHIFMNADDPIQKEKLARYVKKVGFSQEDTQYFNIVLERTEPFVELSFEGKQVRTHLIGTYNFPNCCMAVLIGKYFNVAEHHIKEALERYIPENNRSQILERDGKTVILDAYNANPTSMKAALESFDRMPGNTKAVFLGDMFELGGSSAEEHQNIADLADKLGFHSIVFVGEHFAGIRTDHPQYADFETLEADLPKLIGPATHVLIKGSRGMALERLLNDL
ncbi:UDP-N-acetylmuramoyl-tripeptide--D-alanyl-D-alanine ligase [Flagellimonas sp. DF-77]|uniref:UDP-N-acetylmuramoyl-tripeptide--D-alanyl-D- alanine ligase n=1 Tax=Flagellimonas algarum TaxID=3230298 RepID=UPI00339634DB